jgi:hypothetical protein
MSANDENFEGELLGLLEESSELLQGLQAKEAFNPAELFAEIEAHLAKEEFLASLEANMHEGTPKSLARTKEQLAALEKAMILREYGEV